MSDLIERREEIIEFDHSQILDTSKNDVIKKETSNLGKIEKLWEKSDTIIKKRNVFGKIVDEIRQLFP